MEKEKIKQELINLVMEELKANATVGDFAAIEKLLSYVLTKENSHHFIAYLSEDKEKTFFYGKETNK